jgi:two-component system, NarL family, response regulator DevR
VEVATRVTQLACRQIDPMQGLLGLRAHRVVPREVIVGGKTRLFVVDDHDVVRRRLVGLFNAEADLDVVGEAGTAEEAIALVPVVGPDIAVVDVRLADGDGIELCRKLRLPNPNLKCLMFTGHYDDEMVERAMRAGAGGLVLKQVQTSAIVSAVRLVAAGRTAFDQPPARRGGVLVRGASLTRRERSVAVLIGEGKSNRQIADELKLTEKTVKNYVARLFQKTGYSHRTELAVHMVRLSASQIAPQSRPTRWRRWF